MVAGCCVSRRWHCHGAYDHRYCLHLTTAASPTLIADQIWRHESENKRRGSNNNQSDHHRRHRDRCSHKHNCMMLLCYCRSILMTTAGRRRGDVWLALMIGLRCDARCDTSWWWDYPPRDECDTLWQLSQILTHTWQMCDRSAAQKVHPGNFLRCRPIFNEIKNCLIIFTQYISWPIAVNDCKLW